MGSSKASEMDDEVFLCKIWIQCKAEGAPCKSAPSVFSVDTQSYTNRECGATVSLVGVRRQAFVSHSSTF